MRTGYAQVLGLVVDQSARRVDVYGHSVLAAPALVVFNPRTKSSPGFVCGSADLTVVSGRIIPSCRPQSALTHQRALAAVQDRRARRDTSAPIQARILSYNGAGLRSCRSARRT